MARTNALLPPPYQGQNDQYPIITIQSPYCERMENFNNLDGNLAVRQGNDLFAQATVANYKIEGIVNYGDTFLFAMANNAGVQWNIYDIASGSFGSANSAAGTGVAPATFFFKDNLIFCFGASGKTFLFNGTLFTVDPYTFTSLSPYGGTEFKARAYFIGYGTAIYAYSGIEAVTGACTNVDLSGQLTSKATLSMIRPISMTQNLTAESALAFIFSSGEILVYQGSYPDSDTWSRVSRFKVSQPIEYNAYVEAKGDSFLLTKSEILSLRNLFVSGYDTERDEGIGHTIAKRWRQIITSYSNVISINPVVLFQRIKGVYDEKNDRIIISLPEYVDPITGDITNSTTFQLIYDFNLQAWYEYIQTDSRIIYAVGATYFNNKTYIAVQTNTGGAEMTVIGLERGSNYVDDDLDGSGTKAINYKLRTAPLPISKFGANAITGIEAICKSDLYPQTNYKFIADLGRQESASQAIPAQGTAVAKPMMNVGIHDAITAQLEISGSTVSASIGLELYGFNVWYQTGDPQSR
jgi:hypothetical protein